VLPKPDWLAPTDLFESRQLLLRVFASAIRAVDGRFAVRQTLTRQPIEGRTWLCAIGKAAESMTLGALDALGECCTGGLLITKPDHISTLRSNGYGIETLVAGHPVPTQDSLAAGARLLDAVSQIPPDATRLFLISGGASSLIEVPTRGLDLAKLQQMNQWLLGSGLPIDSVNLVRKSVSQIKGGGLLTRLAGSPLRFLAISDVPGDDPGVIGSGLLVPEPDLAARVARLELPDWLRRWVREGLTERGAPAAQGPVMELVATLATAKAATAASAQQFGLPIQVHDAFLNGNAADRGRQIAAMLASAAPGLHVWGGETTVHLPPTPGRGGRNQHVALAAAIDIAGRNDILILSAGTDGTDGPTEDAGALIDGGTLERAELAGFNAADALRQADSGSCLEASGDLIRTGPTGTNVMDLVLGLKLTM
jgi:glycerate 2-kinase